MFSRIVDKKCDSIFSLWTSTAKKRSQCTKFTFVKFNSKQILFLRSLFFLSSFVLQIDNCHRWNSTKISFEMLKYQTLSLCYPQFSHEFVWKEIFLLLSNDIFFKGILTRNLMSSTYLLCHDKLIKHILSSYSDFNGIVMKRNHWMKIIISTFQASMWNLN